MNLDPRTGSVGRLLAQCAAVIAAFALTSGVIWIGLWWGST